MSDFTINIDSKLDLSDAETKIKNFIKTYSNDPIQIKVELDPKSINTSNFGKQIQSSFSSVGTNAGKAYSTALQAQINTMAKTQRNAFSEPLKNISKYEKSYSDMWNRLLSKAPSTYGKNQQQIAFDKYFAQVEQMAQKASEVQKRVSQKFLDVESSSIKKTLTKYSGTNSSEYKALESSYSKLISLQKELKTGISDDGFGKTLSDKEMVLKYQQFYEVLTKCKNEMKLLSNESSSFAKPFNQLDATTASNKTLTWLKNNSKAAKDYGDRLKELAELQRTATNADDLKNYTKQVNEIKTLAASQGKTGASFGAEFKRAFGQIGQFTAIYGVIQRIPQVISNMTTQVINVDDAITNLRMATSISNEEALKLMSTYSKLGDELKATSVDVAASATEWLKQGKSIQEAQNLAKDSIVLSKIGGLSSEESTKTITAAMKSYNMAESEVMGFVDKISAIDLVSATDVGGLSQAFNEVAANAKNAGVETEKLLSYAAVIGETSQEGMASVGTSLNAIFSRMGNIKLSRLKDYETGEDLSNVETVLRGVGIQLRGSQDQFREFDDVLDDTASKWASFSSVQQRAIASAFAGTHHMNSFLILMQNWNKVQEYTKTANEASGQSMEKFAAYQESATGKIEGFKNAFQSLSTTVIDSNVFKGLIDSGTTLLNILTQLIDVGSIIPLIFGGTAVVKAIENFDRSNDFVLYGCESIVA